eukprot:TRINITY_DN7587_c0_g6_i3.p1 TRINITY_DN7587_c0_g6~~TRINITY_DN7587_c0_g6_i3.p1  ORF type:complete len:125 (-),score=22.94 TRINITY_DN7587_c0_g6_i3:118-492(-)
MLMPPTVPASMLAPGCSASSSAAVQASSAAAIQGLASWPAAWIPSSTPSPVPSSSRVSLPHSQKPNQTKVLPSTTSTSTTSVAASPAVGHRTLLTGQWGYMSSVGSRVSLAPGPPSSPPLATNR